MIGYYVIMALAAIVVLIICLASDYNQKNIYITDIIMLSTITNLAYLALALSKTVEEAILANKIMYIGGCFFPLILFFSIISICNFSVPRIVKFLMAAYSFMVYAFVLSIGYSDFYYKDAWLEYQDGVAVLEKTYGPGHTFSTVLLYGYILLSILVIIYSLIKKKYVSYKTLFAVSGVLISAVLMFLASRAFHWTIEVMPITYVTTGMVMLFNQEKLNMCNVEKGIAMSSSYQQVYGYIVLDRHGNYMGSNRLAQGFIPELKQLRVERGLPKEIAFFACVNEWIRDENRERAQHEYHQDGMHYVCSVRRVYRRKRLNSFVIEMKDDSQRWEYIKLLEETTAKADAANQAKSTFLANMSHEIRTPINAVLGMNEMIIRESREPEIYDYAQEIKSAAKSLLGIINDILDIAKIEAGKLTIIPTEYSLSTLIRDIYNMLYFKAESKELKFVTDIDGSLPSALIGDEIRIKQILVNLLNNAVKYTQKGSVVFEIKSMGKGRIYFGVKDTGIGIRPEDIEKLYVPFERIEEKRNHRIEGTGLGMSITVRLLEMMGSELKVESIYGEGSQFSFVLEQEVVNETPIGDAVIAGKRKFPKEQYKVSYTAPDAEVLVVDDSHMNRKVFTSLLKGTKIRISQAANGQECLELAAKQTYHMIFVDHMMPDMDGMETFRRLREQRLCDNTPIIMLTANAMIGEKEKYISYGFRDFLSKPIVPEELEAMILRYLPKKLINGGNEEN